MLGLPVALCAITLFAMCYWGEGDEEAAAMLISHRIYGSSVLPLANKSLCVRLGNMLIAWFLHVHCNTSL